MDNRVNSLVRVNDFVVKFANVNGSGSASANGLFARAVLRMGVPVAARNIFPSNIQGLPTWYEVRIVEAGWRGRRGGVDLMVAMNPQTWDKDVAEIDSGGYLFYDSTKPLTPSKFRDDVTALGVPLTAICNETYRDVRQRQLFKNIGYLGALSALLDLDPQEIERLFAEQYRGKEALLESNRKALRLGRDYALANFECPIGLSGARRRVRRRDGCRVVSDHAVVVAGRELRQLVPEASRRARDGQAAICDRAGRGRAVVDRHGHWRGVERSARVHRDVGPRRFADAGIPGARLFRGDSGGAVRRAARQPVDRHADAHAAGGSHLVRVRVARRHEARAAAAGRPGRVLRIRGARVRSRRPLADAGVRHARPWHAGLADRAPGVG